MKGHSPNTSGLQNYWSNVLVYVNSGNDHPRLFWGPHPTFTATNYRIYRGVSETHVNPLLVTYNYVAQTNSSTYEWTDNEFLLDGSNDRYAYYYVKAYNSGSSSYSSGSNIIDIGGDFNPYKMNTKENIVNTAPDKTELHQNYPNPFNPFTSINYSIAENSFVSLNIYDVLGNKVADLVKEMKGAGSYTVSFDGSKLSSGIYLYVLRANNYSISKKMILAK